LRSQEAVKIKKLRKLPVFLTSSSSYLPSFGPSAKTFYYYPVFSANFAYNCVVFSASFVYNYLVFSARRIRK
jgi:hypothetical protein